MPFPLHSWVRVPEPQYAPPFLSDHSLSRFKGGVENQTTEAIPVPLTHKFAMASGVILNNRKREIQDTTGFPNAKKKVVHRVLERVFNEDKDSSIIQYECEEEQSSRVKESFKLNKESFDRDSDLYIDGVKNGNPSTSQGP